MAGRKEGTRAEAAAEELPTRLQGLRCAPLPQPWLCVMSGSGRGGKVAGVGSAYIAAAALSGSLLSPNGLILLFFSSFLPNFILLITVHVILSGESDP